VYTGSKLYTNQSNPIGMSIKCVSAAKDASTKVLQRADFRIYKDIEMKKKMKETKLSSAKYNFPE